MNIRKNGIDTHKIIKTIRTPLHLEIFVDECPKNGVPIKIKAPTTTEPIMMGPEIVKMELTTAYTMHRIVVDHNAKEEEVIRLDLKTPGYFKFAGSSGEVIAEYKAAMRFSIVKTIAQLGVGRVQTLIG